MSHLAASAALTAPVASSFTSIMRANAKELQKKHKACIMFFMNGGPPTIDIWDLKPGAPTGGPFKEIETSAPGVKISEHMPLMAKQMHHAAILRSMSTREADHNRGRYYMHTGYVPNPNITHPSYGAVLAKELSSPDLEIPPFVSVGGSSFGPGFLGMSYAPFVVDTNGDVRNLNMNMEPDRLAQRLTLLNQIEGGFAASGRGESPIEHKKVIDRTVSLMTSEQMKAFKVDDEPANVKERYGISAPGAQQGMGMMRRNPGVARGALIARRLVERGVPFVEVEMGGWDLHANTHDTLKNNNLPVLDQAMSALIEDLDQRGMLQDTAVIWMGDFGRTPRINARAGRDHWARCWSTVVAGGGIKGGQAVGATNEDGTAVATDPIKSEDMMASVLKGLGVSLETTYTSKNNRPMKIANSGKVIKELFS
jgi:uncharacterized protein (DUF1501 family)